MDPTSKAQRELEHIEKQIAHLEAAAGENQEAHHQLQRLQEQVEELRSQMHAHLDAWQKTELARHPQRPYTLDYVERSGDFLAVMEAEGYNVLPDRAFIARVEELCGRGSVRIVD